MASEGFSQCISIQFKIYTNPDNHSSLAQWSRVPWLLYHWQGLDGKGRWWLGCRSLHSLTSSLDLLKTLKWYMLGDFYQVFKRVSRGLGGHELWPLLHSFTGFTFHSRPDCWSGDNRDSHLRGRDRISKHPWGPPLLLWHLHYSWDPNRVSLFRF